MYAFISPSRMPPLRWAPEAPVHHPDSIQRPWRIVMVHAAVNLCKSSANDVYTWTLNLYVNLIKGSSSDDSDISRSPNSLCADPDDFSFAIILSRTEGGGVQVTVPDVLHRRNDESHKVALRSCATRTARSMAFPVADSMSCQGQVPKLVLVQFQNSVPPIAINHWTDAEQTMAKHEVDCLRKDSTRLSSNSYERKRKQQH